MFIKTNFLRLPSVRKEIEDESRSFIWLHISVFLSHTSPLPSHFLLSLFLFSSLTVQLTEGNWAPQHKASVWKCFSSPSPMLSAWLGDMKISFDITSSYCFVWFIFVSVNALIFIWNWLKSYFYSTHSSFSLPLYSLLLILPVEIWVWFS